MIRSFGSKKRDTVGPAQRPLCWPHHPISAFVIPHPPTPRRPTSVRTGRRSATHCARNAHRPSRSPVSAGPPVALLPDSVSPAPSVRDANHRRARRPDAPPVPSLPRSLPLSALLPTTPIDPMSLTRLQQLQIPPFAAARPLHPACKFRREVRIGRSLDLPLHPQTFLMPVLRRDSPFTDGQTNQSLRALLRPPVFSRRKKESESRLLCSLVFRVSMHGWAVLHSIRMTPGLCHHHTLYRASINSSPGPCPQCNCFHNTSEAFAPLKRSSRAVRGVPVQSQSPAAPNMSTSAHLPVSSVSTALNLRGLWPTAFRAPSSENLCICFSGRGGEMWRVFLGD